MRSETAMKLGSVYVGVLVAYLHLIPHLLHTCFVCAHVCMCFVCGSSAQASLHRMACLVACSASFQAADLQKSVLHVRGAGAYLLDGMSQID